MFLFQFCVALAVVLLGLSDNIMWQMYEISLMQNNVLFIV